ncbi:MAG: AmmeMemoRadiSam system protein B, partial [bacterium]|nr:AmmeMemoRadiSam system protein B [bacterium]
MSRILTLLAAMVFTGAAIWGAVFQLTNSSRFGENAPALQEAATPQAQISATPTFSVSQFSAAGGVVPHHLLAQEIIDDFFRSLSKKGIPETIVLLSPDHFNAWLIKGQKFIGPDLTIEKLDGLTIDREILQKLIAENRITAGTSFILAEHGITALLSFVKSYFPETKVLPLLAPPDIKEREVEELINIINTLASEKTIIIASVDFSHYLPKSAADFHDIKSIAALIHYKEDEFADLEVDCWQCLYGARLFAKLRGREFPEIIAHKNSVDFLSFDSAQDEPFDSDQGKPDAEETTSYFSVVFAAPPLAPPLASPTTEPAFPEFNAKTVLLVGFFLLGLYVEKLMKKNDKFNPFRKIDNFLKGT